MNIINERIEAICKAQQHIDDDYTRARAESSGLCEYIFELETELEKIRQERDQFKERLLTYIKSM